LKKSLWRAITINLTTCKGGETIEETFVLKKPEELRTLVPRVSRFPHIIIL